VFSANDSVIQISANTSSNDRINIQGAALNNVKALSRSTITDGTTTSTAQELLAAINSAVAVAVATGSEPKKINDVYNAIVDAINSSQKLSSSSKDSAIDLLGKIKQAYFSAYAQPSFATLTYFAIDAKSLLTVNQNPGADCIVNARSYLTSGFIPDAPAVEIWNPSTGQGRIIRGVEAGVGTGRVYETAPSSVTSGQSNALSSITAIDLALTEVNNASALQGAVQNRLSAVISNLTAFSQSQTAAKSRIVDADFATETAKLSTNSILQQSGSAMLTQANQSSSNVLALLSGL
jgi:flagellin